MSHLETTIEAECVPDAEPKLAGLSRMSNGTQLLDGVDGRTRPARRYRDILDGLIVELGSPGEGEMSLARRAAGLSVWIEQQEALQARAEPVDIGALTTATNSLRRLLSDLGLSRGGRGRRRRPHALSGVPGAAAT